MSIFVIHYNIVKLQKQQFFFFFLIVTNVTVMRKMRPLTSDFDYLV